MEQYNFGIRKRKLFIHDHRILVVLRHSIRHFGRGEKCQLREFIFALYRSPAIQNMNPNPPIKLKKQCSGFAFSPVNEEYVRKLSVT